MKRLGRTRKLFAFLREYRDQLFDDDFQFELGTMYRSTGAGKAPVPPALLAMATLLQAYHGMSDAETVELTVVDLRWQLVLGCLGTDEPAFSQGALCDFRARLISHDLDRRLLERTIELGKQTQAFDWKKLPKTLRVAVDSMPLEGAGRVEDTFNLLAHAAHKALACVAELLERPAANIAKAAGAPLLATGLSIKRALDVEWSDPQQKAEALRILVEQLDALGPLALQEQQPGKGLCGNGLLLADKGAAGFLQDRAGLVLLAEIHVKVRQNQAENIARARQWAESLKTECR